MHSAALRHNWFGLIFRDRFGARWFWRALLMIACIAGAAFAFTTLWAALELPPRRVNGVIDFWPYVVTGIAIFGTAVLGVFVAMRFSEPRPFVTALGSPGRDAPRMMLWGALLGCVAPLLFVMAMAWRGDAVFEVNSIAAADIIARMLPMLLVFVCMAGFEELMLRGYGLQLLIEGVGQRWAIVISGAVFGLIHATNPGANPIGLVNNAVIGGLLAMIIIRTGSLIYVWAYHAAWNAFATFVFGLSVSGHDLALVSFFHTTLHGTEAMTGGAYGFEGSVLIAPIETAVLLIGYLLAPKPAPGVSNQFQRGELMAWRKSGWRAPWRLGDAADWVSAGFSASVRRARLALR